MVEVDLAGRDIVDPRVLTAMQRVPRHLFVDDAQVGQAYEDRALPIGRGQTISQPYIVAFTAQALAVALGDRILEVERQRPGPFPWCCQPAEFVPRSDRPGRPGRFPTGGLPR